jgi:hypothetical protein
MMHEEQMCLDGQSLNKGFHEAGMSSLPKKGLNSTQL